MKKLLGLLALTAAVVLSPAAQAQMPSCTPSNNCYVFSTSGNGTFQVTAIPPGTTTIQVQIISTGMTVAGTAQIQTAASISGGALVSPVNCGSSATIPTTGGVVTTLTCTLTSAQPWISVGLNVSAGAGTTSGDVLTFQSAIMGRNAISVFGHPASYVITCITTPIAHTGDTTNDVVTACPITAGTLTVGSVIEVSASVLTAAANTGNVIGYILPSASSTSGAATVAWTNGIAANRNGTAYFSCTVSAASTLNCGGFGQNGSGILQNQSGQASFTQTISTAGTIYVLMYLQNSVAGDTGYAQQLFIRVTRMTV